MAAIAPTEPLPVVDKIEDERRDVECEAVVLENEFLLPIAQAEPRKDVPRCLGASFRMTRSLIQSAAGFSEVV